MTDKLYIGSSAWKIAMLHVAIDVAEIQPADIRKSFYEDFDSFGRPSRYRELIRFCRPYIDGLTETQSLRDIYCAWLEQREGDTITLSMQAPILMHQGIIHAVNSNLMPGTSEATLGTLLDRINALRGRHVPMPQQASLMTNTQLHSYQQQIDAMRYMIQNLPNVKIRFRG